MSDRIAAVGAAAITIRDRCRREPPGFLAYDLRDLGRNHDSRQVSSRPRDPPAPNRTRGTRVRRERPGRDIASKSLDERRTRLTP
jgi:hypothetical protein